MTTDSNETTQGGYTGSEPSEHPVMNHQWTPPAVQVPPAGPPSPRRRPTIFVAGILAVALVATSAMWLITASRLSDTETQLASTSAELSASQQVGADRAADAAAVPDLKKVASAYFTGVRGDAESIELTITDGNSSQLGDELSDLLDELGFSSAVLNRMSSTRALDGTLTAEGKNCNVSWTYHPDDGLQMVFEVET